MEAAGVSLYVHVPFCRSKCGYCTFTSYPGMDAEIQAAVTRRTIDEARAWTERLGGLAPSTVYVGGGTPSALRPEVLDDLLTGIQGLCGTSTVELTAEANPESLTRRFLDACAAAGVTRLSLGVQTFSGRLRQAVRRCCSDHELARGLELAGKGWRGELSLDLISGLPGQKPGEVAADVDRAVERTPEHVSLYALTLEEGISGIVSAEAADELWLEGYARLEECGYPNYEVSNFSAPGRECRHNLRYWRLEPYLGVGPAAVSTLPDGAGGVVRRENPRSLEAYLAEPADERGTTVEQVSAPDFLFENLIMGLRLREGLEQEGFQRRFGRPIAELLPRTLRRWTEEGLLQDRPGRVALEDRARMLLNSLLVEAREEIDDLAEGAIRLSWP